VNLRNVQRLVGEGINLAGIARIIQLEEAVANMSLEVAKLRVEVDTLLLANPPKSLVKRNQQTVVVYTKD
jgi:MerR family transcriptional regulator/heat shock protein HspR